MYGFENLKGESPLLAFIVVFVVAVIVSFLNIVLFIPLAWVGLELLQRFDFLSSFSFSDVLIVSVFFYLFNLFNRLSNKFYTKEK